MGARLIQRNLKDARKELNRHFKRGEVTRVTIVQDQTGKVVVVSTSYERAQAALNRLGRQDDPLLMEDFEVAP